MKKLNQNLGLIFCMCAHIYTYIMGYCLILIYRVTPTYFLPESKMKQGDNLPKAVSYVLLDVNCNTIQKVLS